MHAALPFGVCILGRHSAFSLVHTGAVPEMPFMQEKKAAFFVQGSPGGIPEYRLWRKPLHMQKMLQAVCIVRHRRSGTPSENKKKNQKAVFNFRPSRQHLHRVLQRFLQRPGPSFVIFIDPSLFSINPACRL